MTTASLDSPPASLPGIRLSGGFAFRAGQAAFLHALSNAFARGEANHLGVFVPGYGKTITALAAFLVARAHGFAQRLVVFVPRGNLRDQYADGAALERLFRGLGAPPMTFCATDSDRVFLKNLKTDILVTTYQYAAGDAGHRALLKYCEEAQKVGGAMFVFDEVHHLSDDGTWARKIADLPFSCSVALSGTPMRSDNKTLFGVPFETRVEGTGPNARVEHFYVALHEVGLKDAHAEGGILKHVEAHVVDYRLKMVRQDTGEVVEMSLSGLREAAPTSTEVDIFLARRMLRFHDVYLDTLLTPAFERFDEKRRALHATMRAHGRPPGTFRDHQLLVIAMSNAHAAAVLDYIARFFPQYRSARIGQDLPSGEVAARLDDYREGRLDVMVQVDMIGEGTDIKPISVIVKADLVRAVSKTLQQVFRGMRYYDGWPEEANTCDLYAANDTDVVTVLDWITREEQLGVKAKRQVERAATGPGAAPERSRWELAHVEHHRSQRHALALETTAKGQQLALREMPTRPAALDVNAREKQLRKDCAELANELSKAIVASASAPSIRAIHARAKERIGASQAELSLPQLELKKRWLEKCLKYGRLL